MTKIFRPLLGRNTEVYIDDMLIKSKLSQNHLRDLAKAFAILHRYDMMLNQEKCVFGVQVGKFLGYLVTKCEIEASLEQIRAL